MNKIKIITSIAVVAGCLVAGCVKPPEEATDEIQLRGHHYLVFRYDRSASYVHDPDCRCLAKTRPSAE